MKYTFAYLRDYMSAKGIEIKKLPGGGYEMKDRRFFTVKDLALYIRNHY